jgi:hypothetical protein
MEIGPTPRQTTFAGIRRIRKRHDVSRNELINSRVPRACRARQEVAHYLQAERGMSTTTIAGILECDHSSVVNMLQRFAALSDG